MSSLPLRRFKVTQFAAPERAVKTTRGERALWRTTESEIDATSIRSAQRLASAQFTDALSLTVEAV